MATTRVERARLFGVLGDPVEHSLSPAMHNAAFAALRLPHVYLRYRVPPDRLAEALDEARTLGMGGLNLTVPLKEAVLPLLHRLTSQAQRAGAVNTVLFRRNGTLVGDNTDGRGFVRALRRDVRLRGGHAVLVGAGGSARAVGTALADAGCTRLTVTNRTPARADALAAHLRGLGADVEVAPLSALTSRAVLADARLVVNTTSIGLGAGRLAVQHGLTPPTCVFVDLVYGPTPSAWVAAARRAGRRASDGAGMLLYQGALALEAWLRRPAPLAAMASALRAAGLALPGPGGSRRAVQP